MFMCVFMHIYIYIYILVGDSCLGRPEGSFFNSYDTEL